MLLWWEGSISINDTKNRIYCNLGSDGICGSHTSCNNMLSKLKRILPHRLLQKSRRKMMKQLLQAHFFLRQIYWPCVQHLSKVKKKKKKPRHESETSCECVLPVCLPCDFLPLITDVRGKAEKQTLRASFSVLNGRSGAQIPSSPFLSHSSAHLSSTFPAVLPAAPALSFCTHTHLYPLGSSLAADELPGSALADDSLPLLLTSCLRLHVDLSIMGIFFVKSTL